METRRTIIEARRGTEVEWRTLISGGGGVLARTGVHVIAANATGEPVVRGSPGAQVVALAADGGAIAWTIAFGATEWSLVSALAAAGDDVIVAGSFAGTMRVGNQVVSSGGKSDGFVARLGGDGNVKWLVRLGGPGPDAVQGVAVSGERIALAGTFTAGADLLGAGLPAWDERMPFSDCFVAELDAAGARRWSRTFGSAIEDAVSGVAIDSRGRVAVAVTARDAMRIDGVEHEARGAADALVSWWTDQGEAGPVQMIGGDEADGLVAIVAAGDTVVIAGFYAGTIRVGDAELTAGGGDGAFLAALDPQGMLRATDIAGEGREEVAVLATAPGGIVAGIQYTAGASIDGITLPAPADPLAGAAVIVRPAATSRAP